MLGKVALMRVTRMSCTVCCLVEKFVDYWHENTMKEVIKSRVLDSDGVHDGVGPKYYCPASGYQKSLKI